MVEPPVLPAEVAAAHERIRTYVHRTPVLRSRTLDHISGASVFLKCENLQKTGSFKVRGATNTLAMLADEVRERGVVTHSSGNHAQALAQAAAWFRVPCTVVMPENAPGVKRRATEGYGARVVPCAPTLAAREEATARVIAATGAVLVHPYDDPRIIAGQGTAARELLEEVPDLDVVVAQVGGGGLLSGTALAAAAHRERTEHDTRVWGGEPRGADDAHRSLASGVRVAEHVPDTIADGLLTTLGKIPFEVLRSLDVPVRVVSDEEIVAAMRLLWERAKLVVEPSGAVALAAVLGAREQVAGRRVGVILSGGNVDVGPLIESYTR
jgi:threonine dehydratase